MSLSKRDPLRLSLIHAGGQPLGDWGKKKCKQKEHFAPQYLGSPSWMFSLRKVYCMKLQIRHRLSQSCCVFLEHGKLMTFLPFLPYTPTQPCPTCSPNKSLCYFVLCHFQSSLFPWLDFHYVCPWKGQALNKQGPARCHVQAAQTPRKSIWINTIWHFHGPIISLTFCFRWEAGRGIFENGLMFSYQSCPQREIWADEQFTLSSHVHKMVNWAFEVAMTTLSAYEIK